MRDRLAGPRLRIAWVEEWMSTLAAEILPGLALRHDVTYVTAGEELPAAPFVRVVRGRRRRHMNLAGFELSRQVNRLYDDGLIDLAMVWASIGFGLRRVPFINLEGTSVYAEIELFQYHQVDDGVPREKLNRDVWLRWRDKGTGGTQVAPDADP